MKDHINYIIKIIRYFFTPEDSATPIRKSTLSFHIEHDAIGIGSAKALFWVMNSVLLMWVLSLL